MDDFATVESPDEHEQPSDVLECSTLTVSSQEFFSEPQEQPEKKRFVSFAQKEKAVRFWMSGRRADKRGKPKRMRISNIKSKFRYVSSVQQLYEWERQIFQPAPGSRNEKLMAIFKATIARWKEADERDAVVKGRHIRRWAIEANLKVGLVGFKASHQWVHEFKRLNHISDRKINVVVTAKTCREQIPKEDAALEFVHNIRTLMEPYGPDCTFNADQSGFKYEIRSGRRLATTGTKKVRGAVQSVNATRHSYTIMPTCDAEGRVKSPLFIVMQETNGIFGPLVQQTMFQAENIHITAFKSGLMEKKHLAIWLREAFFRSVGQKALLLVDSWPTNKDSQFVKECVPSGVQFKMRIIPAGTTGLIQPCDVYGFRLWKEFVRHISDKIDIQGIDCDLHIRNNILKLQSLVRNQFSCPRFRETFRHGWYEAGYVEDASEFLTPKQFCFESEAAKTLEKCKFCERLHFITCAWCRSTLCFAQWFDDYHYCTHVA